MKSLIIVLSIIAAIMVIKKMKIKIKSLDEIIDEYNKNQEERKIAGQIFNGESSRENKKEIADEITKKRIKKGKDYELYVGAHYENNGYNVKYLGIEKGVEDGGIDLIARKDNDVIFMQCKNWHSRSKYKIKHTDIKAFMGVVLKFMMDNEEYKNLNYKLLYIASNNIFDYSAIKYCNDNAEYIRYEYFPIKTCTTKELAILHNKEQKKMVEILIKNEYLEYRENRQYLTQKGKEVAELKKGKYGNIFIIWNENIELKY